MEKAYAIKASRSQGKLFGSALCPTTITTLLDAYHEDPQQPTPALTVRLSGERLIFKQCVASIASLSQRTPLTSACRHAGGMPTDPKSGNRLPAENRKMSTSRPSHRQKIP